jgi:hypothetical protein
MANGFCKSGVMNILLARMQIVVGLILALFLAACSSTPTAQMDFDPAFNFSKVQKIAIQPFERTAESQVILSDMQINRVNESLSAELQRRGFQLVANGADADMFLAWHLVTQERTDIRTFDTMTSYNCWNCRRMGMGTTTNVDIQNYTEGTFIVDMIDPAQQKAVWRSVFQSRMRNHSDQASATEARNAAVAASLAEFPPLTQGQ